MGKHRNNKCGDTDEVDQFEIKVLIPKCNVCQNNLDNDREHVHECCKRNGSIPKGGEHLNL